MEVTTASKKASCQLRLAQKWLALRAVAIDSPFSSPTQTRALSLTPKSSLSPEPVERLQSQDEEPKCTMTLCNYPQIQIQNWKYLVKAPMERCQKGLTGFCFFPCSFSAAAPTPKATSLPSQLSVPSHSLTSTETELQNWKCLVTAPTQKVTEQLFLAVSFPMQPFNSASRWEYELA